MAERLGLRGGLGSSWPLLCVLAALICAAVLTVVPATTSAAPQPAVAAQHPLPIPGAFRLTGSNGYTLYVVGLESRGGEGDSGSVLIFAFAKGKGVSYRAPATVTETSIQADLGELGEISVSFQRTDRATSVPCGKRAVRFDSGLYEGSIVFNGEEGYTSVEATSVPGNIDYFLAVCEEVISESFVGGGPSRRPPGAALFVRNPGLGPQLSVTKTRAGAAAFVDAWTREFTNGISIERYASQRVPSEAFRYDRRLRTATLRPPAPFTGSAHFDLGKKAGQRWSGSLTVDLPGRAGLPLTGPSLRATLSPYR